jgi:hypothetical protein
MKILSRNTQVLEASLRFNEPKTILTYQANTELYVEGNPYLDLMTPQTIFNLTCNVSDTANIMEKTQEQIDAYILANYPEVIE